MSLPLRSSRSALRISRRGVDLVKKSRLHDCHPFQSQHSLAPFYARRYASTQPEDPKNRKSRKPVEKSEKDKTQNAPSRPHKAAKSAPGMENLYSKQSPLASASRPKSPESSADMPTDNKLSPEDEKTLQDILQTIRGGVNESQWKDMQEAVRILRSQGVPPELTGMLEVYRGNKSLDLATVAKLVRITSRLARTAAEVTHKRITREQQGEEDAEQKAGRHDPGAKEEKGKKQNKSNSGFSFNGINLKDFKFDNGTFIVSTFVTYLLWRSIFPGENSKDITWQEFKTSYLNRGLVQKLTVLNNNRVRVTLDTEAVRSVYPDSIGANGNFYFYFSIGDVATFERHLDDAQIELGIPSSQRIPVQYSEVTPWFSILLGYGPTILLMVGTYWLLRRSSGSSGGSGGIFGMGKSRAKRFNHESDIKIGFRDVAGMDEAKQEITEFVSFLKEPGIYKKLGAKIPRGAILSGPPGTGKTLLAKATAGESSVPFFSVSGSEFVEMFVGVGASRVRDLFQTARKNTPCIIFIDEIDAIGKSRGKGLGSGGNDEREATLNQILTEMDGFNTSEQVVVLAGTNRADVLDQALLRPGRFDRHIAIDRPTMEGRKQIFAVHLKKIVTNEDLDHLYGRLAALTPGFSGADIANCVNEAALVGKSLVSCILDTCLR